MPPNISPGPIVTPMTEMLRVQDPSLHEIFKHANPLPRMGDVDADIAPAVLYLLSDAGSWITGIDIPITGGAHAGVGVNLIRQGTASYKA